MDKEKMKLPINDYNFITIMVFAIKNYQPSMDAFISSICGQIDRRWFPENVDHLDIESMKRHMDMIEDLIRKW